MSPDILLILSILLGIILIYPLGPKLFPFHKRAARWAGVILLHAGAYGLLWREVPHVTFSSIVLLEFGFLLFLDPFRLIPDLHRSGIRSLGLLFMLTGGFLLLSVLARFPLWLWLFPLAALGLSKTMSEMNSKRKPLFLISVLLTLAFLGFIGYRLYPGFFTELKEPSPEAQRITEEPAIVPIPTMPPPPPQGVLSATIHEIDERMESLEAENKSLKLQVQKLSEENALLKEEISKKSGALQEQNQKIEDVKQVIQ